MRINCVICVTGPARGALGPVRFLCTLLWGFGGLAWPTFAQALGLVPCALGQTTATNWANLRLGRSGSGALPLHLLWVFRGLGPPWHRHWVRFPVALAKPQNRYKYMHVDPMACSGVRGIEGVRLWCPRRCCCCRPGKWSGPRPGGLALSLRDSRGTEVQGWSSLALAAHVRFPPVCFD